MQVMARKALADGLVRYDEGQGWRGPVAKLELSGDWGVKLADVKANVPQECQVNPPQATCNGLGGTVVPTVPAGNLTVFYQGLNAIPLVTPPNPPPPQPPPFAAPSTAINRIEPVTFPEPGRYLVICAVLEHFNDGMMAWIDVRPRGQGDDHGGHGGHGDHD
jgi:hypothetical protein